MVREPHSTENPRPQQRSVTAAVGVTEASKAALAVSGFHEPDYADEFTLHIPEGSTATAEDWARAMFGDAPDVGQRFIFQGLLRLQLATDATRDTVVGFDVTERTPKVVRLEATSKLLRCHLVIQALENHTSLTTVMYYQRRRGQITWAVVSRAHRLLAPGLLRDAVKKLAS